MHSLLGTPGYGIYFFFFLFFFFFFLLLLLLKMLKGKIVEILSYLEGHFVRARFVVDVHLLLHLSPVNGINKHRTVCHGPMIFLEGSVNSGLLFCN